jgi:predicted aminopeptidase
VRRWLEHTSDPAKRAGYAQYTRRKTQFLSLLEDYQHKLTDSFSSQASVEKKRRDKAALMRDMQGEYKQLRASWGGYNGYDEWFRDSVDNAHLASFATYHALVPGFRELLARSTGIAQFYKTAASMAELPEQQRRAQLLSLGGQSMTLEIGTHQISALPVGPPKQGKSSRPVKVSLRTG